jgi:hypothetical protein
MNTDHELERQVYALREDMRGVQLLLLIVVLAGCFFGARMIATQPVDVPVGEREATR